MGEDAHWAHASIGYKSDVAGGCCPRVILDLLGEEHHQFCSALEGVKNPRRCRSRRAGESTGGEPEVQGYIDTFFENRLRSICSVHSMLLLVGCD